MLHQVHRHVPVLLIGISCYKLSFMCMKEDILKKQDINFLPFRIMYLLLLEIYSENYYYDEEVLVLLLGSQCTNWFVCLH